MAKKLRLDFGNLPLMEAAARVSLAQPIKLSFALLSRVHEVLRQDFPYFLEPSQFERPPGIPGSLTLSPGQLLGALFKGNGSGLEISLQTQVLTSRWLRSPGSRQQDYPRFVAVRNSLRQALAALSDAYTDELPSVAVVNLSYVNIIQLSHATPVVNRYLSDNAHLGIAKSAQQVYKLEASWQETTAIDLRYCIEQVHAKIPNGAQANDSSIEAFSLTTAAGSRIDATDECWDRMDRIHDRLQEFFIELLSKQSKDEWQLRVVPLE